MTPAAKRLLTNHDIELAIKLKAAGWKWREIGKCIADRKARPVPYQANTIANAVWRAKRGALPEAAQ